MNSHNSMTPNEDSIPVLLVSTEAPLDVLHASAASRFLAITQMMESLASLDISSANGADVQQLAYIMLGELPVNRALDNLDPQD